MTEVLETDVLVIGGGAAGTSAVLEAADRGAKVTMVVKGLIGKSGCSVFASTIPFGTPTKEWLVEDVAPEERERLRLVFMVRYYNHYLADQGYCRRLDAYMRTDFFGDLERLGAYWRRDNEGHIQPTGSRRTPNLVAHKQGATGPAILDKRRREIFRRGITVHEECAVTSLLTDGERVVGATVLDYRRGKFFAIAAKSTILATGHSDYLATRSTGTREQSADGVAMALRVGAEARQPRDPVVARERRRRTEGMDALPPLPQSVGGDPGDFAPLQFPGRDVLRAEDPQPGRFGAVYGTDSSSIA